MGKKIQQQGGIDKYLIVIFVSIFIVSSCKQTNKRIEYYKSGEIEFIDSFVSPNNVHDFYCKRYYKNGIILHEGLIKNDSIREGHWKKYYNDGSLWWEGNFKHSVIQHHDISKNWIWPNVQKYFIGAFFKGNPEYLLKNHTYEFRVIMPKIHPQLYIVTDKYFNKLDNNLDTETYQYCLHTGDEDKISIFIVFMNKDGVFTVRNPKIQYDLPVLPDSNLVR